MFKKSDTLNSVLGVEEKRAADATESVIGPSVHLEGNFNSSGNIVIIGSLSGSLNTTGNVRIEEGSKVQATVQAANIFVAGELRGDVHATEKIEFSPSARITGNIETKVLSVAPGAMLHGKCAMKNGGASRATVPAVSKKQKIGKSAKIEEQGLVEVDA